MKKQIFVTLILLLAGCTAQEAVIAPTETAVPPTHTPLPTETAEPTTEPTATAEVVTTIERPHFTFVGADPKVPVVTNHPTSQIDNTYINPGAVLYHDGQFHMFFNSFTQWPGLVQIGYMTSPDGITWTPAQDEPVFTSDDIPFVRQGADVSSVVVTDEGVWVMYFHTVNPRGLSAVIGLATAESPLGPWQVAAEPILSGGSAGEWDKNGLAWPSVVKTENGYFLYYGGTDAQGTRRIGLATSPDGLTWTKYDNPETADAPYAESDPVLVPEDTWDEGSVDRMRVVASSEGLVMMYQGGKLSNRALAFSEDGITWTTHPGNPVITGEDFPVFGNTWDTSFVYHEGTYYYFMEIGTMSGTHLYLATYRGTLKP